MKSKNWRIGAILMAVVIVTMAVAGMSFASSDQSNTTTVCADLYQSFVSKLAANLGISQDQVTTALDNTKKQMLDEAVQQGKITQEQADKISAKTNGGFCGGFGFLNGKLREHGKSAVDGSKGKGFGKQSRNLDGMVSVLGMTADEIKTEMQSGKTIDQIITEHGMTMDQFREKMIALKKNNISQ
ncbi:Fis family transcriptional regulator [Pelotomaculum isophthalicicum JI]|uniref:Fis family transcriptional regulator n=1 Tax=Pelotomaculum isophthalicicum JI TaxID=947010 RepID=A0A9X4H6M6_9FIRM|nr:Fis family transcriptional regulator [Pelotomaculum isophthalicicum]MDF9409437.1 Fis family transcriptional regulator [Pelotomaculum isophthalicicum JI]